MTAKSGRFCCFKYFLKCFVELACEEIYVDADETKE